MGTGPRDLVPVGERVAAREVPELRSACLPGRIWPANPVG